jgi:hypothetical protein
VVVTYIKIKDNRYATEVRTVNPDAAEKTAGGIVKKVEAGANRFILTQEGGKDVLYTLADDARVRGAGKDKDVGLGSLKEGSKMTVSYLRIKDDYYATAVEVTP